MQSINEDIKQKRYSKVYLLYGTETYLRKQYRDRLKSALIEPEDSMNYHYFEGKDISFPQVIDLAQTLPFFSERRVIIIENSSAFKGSNDLLVEYMKEIPDTTFFIFIEEEVDKRGRLFKAIKDNGRAVEFNAQDENTLKRWVAGLVKNENKEIRMDALNLFLEKTGTDMANIKQELEKLICYCLKKEVIEISDVQGITTTKITNRIFDMISAIANKKQKQALNLYYDLIELKEPPMRILFLISRQFNLLLQVKELSNLRYDAKRISEKVSLQPFIVKKYMDQSQKFTMDQLKEALVECVSAEENIKTGLMVDSICVELLIVRFSQ